MYGVRCPMKLRQIEAFRAVMMAGSMNGGADALAISRPAVSKLIGDLETSLGFKLFERRKGHVLQPTEDAKVLLVEVEKAFIGLDHLVTTGKDIRALRNGVIRVVGPPFVANGLLAEAASKFLDVYPDVRVSIESRPHDEIVELIATRQQDLGVAVQPVEHPAIEMHSLGKFDAVCALPPDHRLAGSAKVDLRDLDGEPFISNPVGTQVYQLTFEALKALGVNPLIRANVRTQDMACVLVARSKGVAVLFNPLPVNVLHYPGIVIKPLTPPISIELSVLLSRFRAPSRTIGQFLENLLTR